MKEGTEEGRKEGRKEGKKEGRKEHVTDNDVTCDDVTREKTIFT